MLPRWQRESGASARAHLNGTRYIAGWLNETKVDWSEADRNQFRVRIFRIGTTIGEWEAWKGLESWIINKHSAFLVGSAVVADAVAVFVVIRALLPITGKMCYITVAAGHLFRAPRALAKESNPKWAGKKDAAKMQQWFTTTNELSASRIKLEDVFSVKARSGPKNKIKFVMRSSAKWNAIQEINYHKEFSLV